MGGQLFDCQVLNSHTAALGAIEIARDRYLEALSRWKKVIIDKSVGISNRWNYNHHSFCKAHQIFK